MSEASDSDRSIAMVGMAALLPGATGIDSFWANTLNGVVSTGRIPPIACDPTQSVLDTASLQSMPPAHLLALEVTRGGLEDASASGSGAALFMAAPAESATAISAHVAGHLGLAAQPPASSAFAGLAQARHSLLARSCDIAVCCAIDLSGPETAASRAGADIDGPAASEAAVAIVLKRRADAERDCDRIYAIVSGLAVASTTHDAIERAAADATVPASSIGLLDAASPDFAGLESVLRSAPPGTVTLTATSSQAGDAGIAAGLVSVVRTALSLHHRVLPPLLGVSEPPALMPDGPLVLNTTAMPWLGSDHRAAVTGAAAGAAHVVLLDSCDACSAASGLEQWPAELFLVHGATLDDALESVDALLRVLDQPEQRLRDLSRSVSSCTGPVQIAFVATGLDDLRARLRAIRDAKPPSSLFFASDARVPAGSKLAFLFPGQGSQRPGMLRDLFIAFPSLQQHLELGQRWASLILPPTPWTDSEKAAQRERLTDTRVAQPALGVTGMAMAGLLLDLGIRPDALAGHSYGELVALCIAGVFSEADLMSLSDARGRCILEATQSSGDPGSMAAVSAGREAVAALIEPFDGVVIANENSPDQTVVSGPTASIQAAVASMKEKGLSAVQLQVACAFHSPIVAPGSITFRKHLDRVQIEPPRFRVFSNTTAELYPEGPENIRGRLAEHIARSVQFVREIEAMYVDGVRIFVETGPGRVLTGLVAKILGPKPHLALNTDHTTVNGVTQLLTVLAQLAANGVDFDSEALFAGRNAAVLDLDAPSAATPVFWLDSSGLHSSPVPAD